MPNKGTHNLLIVATEHNSVYAFDADTYTLIWQHNFGLSQSSTSVGCQDIQPEYGITGTPVIVRSGPGSGTIYVVAATEPTAGSFQTTLHALNLGTGSDAVTPVSINPSATLSNGSTISFSQQHQMNRPGLVWANSSLYATFGSHCDNSASNTTGWVLRYNSSLALLAKFNTVDDPASYELASIWMSGLAPAVDAGGNIYFATGNGAFDASTGGKNYGESVVKLNSTLSSVAGTFTPSDWQTLNTNDTDLGSGGVMVLPTGDVITIGKAPKIFLMPSTLGTAKQTFTVSTSRGAWGGPAYYHDSTGSFVYYETDHGVISRYAYSGSALSLTSKGAYAGGYGGATPVVSSSGSQTGTAIVWLVQRHPTLLLEGYDASNVSRQLFSGNAGSWPNPENNGFVTPLVANGRVYVGASKTISVFGL